MQNSLKIQEFDGFVKCRSSRGNYLTTCNHFSCEFKNSVYILQGEIDSGAWSVPYAISPVYSRKKEDIIISPKGKFIWNGNQIPLEQIQMKTCYLDIWKEDWRDELLRRPVCSIVQKHITKNKISMDCEDIRKMFGIDPYRFKQRITCVGNEIFQCKAAIGFARGKEIYSFPWLSSKMMMYYSGHIPELCKTLKSLGKIVLLPTSYDCSDEKGITIIRM